MHELGVSVLVFVAAIGFVVAVGLVFTAFLSLCLTPFAVFGWRGNGLNKFRQHLQRCVVEDNCPRGDDALHRYIKKRVWTLDQRFGLFGLIPATFVWGWIDFLRMSFSPLTQFWKYYIRTA